MKKLALYTALLLNCLSGFGQKDTVALKNKGIAILGRHAKDSIILRWAPRNASAWRRSVTYGYRLERITIDVNAKEKPKPQRLGPDSLKPWPLAKWKSSFPADHPAAPIAAQALFGATFNLSDVGSEVIAMRHQTIEDGMRHAYALLYADIDAGVANAQALRWVDRELPTDKLLLYRVYSLDPLFPDTAIIGFNTKNTPDKIPYQAAPAYQEKDKSIELRWNTYPTEPLFTGWYVERSRDSIAWERLNKAPIFNFSTKTGDEPDPFQYYTDTTISANYVTYYYRLIGLTCFGETSIPSLAIKAMGRDRLAPPAPQIQTPLDTLGKFKITWIYPKEPSDFKGFAIGKSSNSTGPFDRIDNSYLPAGTRSWMDEKPDPIGQNYYVVLAFDTAGNMSSSFAASGYMRDSIAPGKPEKPTGNIDTNGIVKLKWKLGRDKDIMGYRVLFANAPDHEFSQLTPLPLLDTTFTDTITLHTLSKKIYYRIAAVDRNYNHSEVSDILALVKPDTIKPVQPLFTYFQVKDSSIVLDFVQSSSDDVAMHQLLRRETSTPNWIKISEWKKPEDRKQYTDATILGGKYYQYALLAIDSAGNKSKPSPTVDVKSLARKTHDKIKSATVLYNLEKKTIDLKWTAVSKPVKYFVIYRGLNGQNPISLTSVEGKINTYSDVTYPGKGKYRYMLKAVYEDFGESPFYILDEVEVK